MFRDSLSNTVNRKAASDPVIWAQRNIVLDDKPFSLRTHPWLKLPLSTAATGLVALKGAQLGFSTIELVKTLYNLDIQKRSTLYLLPTVKPDAMDFSATKLETMVQQSPSLSNLFTDTENLGLKRAGSSVLYIRGANSRNALKSITVHRIVFDEFDEMPAEHIPLALERMSSKDEKFEVYLSTPSIPGVGVDAKFQSSSQEFFTLRCPFCKKSGPEGAPQPSFARLTLECLQVTADSITDPDILRSHLRMPCCGNTLTPDIRADLLAKEQCEYVSDLQNPNYDFRGLHVNQLYSTTIKPHEIAKMVIEARTKPAVEQELHNSKLAQAFKAKGAGLTVVDIDNARRSHRNPTPLPDVIPSISPSAHSPYLTLGADIGTDIHVTVSEFLLPTDKDYRDLMSKVKSAVRAQFKVPAWSHLDTIMRDFQIRSAVVDAQPERRDAIAFARRFPPFVRVCYYNTTQRAASLKFGNDEDGDSDWTITADRTIWFDNVFSAIRANRCFLPSNMSEEASDHLQALTRLYRSRKQKSATDEARDPEAYYTNTGPDHYAHSLSYSHMALPVLLAGLSGNNDLNMYL